MYEKTYGVLYGCWICSYAYLFIHLFDGRFMIWVIFWFVVVGTSIYVNLKVCERRSKMEHPDITFYNRTGMTREQWKKRNEPIEETGTKEKTSIISIAKKVSEFNNLVDGWESERDEQIKIYRSLNDFYIFFTDFSTFYEATEGYPVNFKSTESKEFPLELSAKIHGVLHSIILSANDIEKYEEELGEMQE